MAADRGAGDVLGDAETMLTEGRLSRRMANLSPPGGRHWSSARDATADALGDNGQELVAAFVAEGAVLILETVEIEIDQRKPAPVETRRGLEPDRRRVSVNRRRCRPGR